MRRPDQPSIVIVPAGRTRAAGPPPRVVPRHAIALKRRGLTLAESLMAITIATVSGMAMLTSLGTAGRTSSQAADASVCMGLAEQLMDEVAGVRFPDPINPPASGPRSTFDDMDDFSNYSASPPVDRRGNVIGTEGSDSWGYYLPRPSMMEPDNSLLGRLTQEVQVERVEPSGPTSWVVVPFSSDYRRVTVRIKRTDDNNQVSPMAELTRIFARVPAVP